MADLPKPDYAHRMRLIGHSDQGGRPDGVQLMVSRGFAYIGHMFSKGFSIVDVRDPKNPKPAGYIAAPPDTWNIHLQTHGDLLLVINAKDMFAAAEFQDERAYYKGSLGNKVGTAAGPAATQRSWTAGMAVYDISKPGEPRQIGFMPVQGGGIHRIWYVGGRWAYASALIDGFTDYIFITIDMSDPTKPVEAGRWWIPGMNQAAGEEPSWPPPSATASTTRSSMAIRPIAPGATPAWSSSMSPIAARPKLIVHRNWSPPFGGGTHNCLPLPGRELLCVLDEAVLDNMEDGLKLIWLFDNRVVANPISISTLPVPSDADYSHKGAHCGPHNVYENRPEGLVSEDLIFATMQNAGLRIYDIRNQYQPVEVGAYVPPAPAKLIDHRPGRPQVVQTCDVFVDKAGLIYANDYNGGLSIMEWDG